MARPNPKKIGDPKKPGGPTFNPKDARPKPFLGILFAVLGVLSLVSILDYSPEQNPRLTTAVEDPVEGGGAVDPPAPEGEGGAGTEGEPEAAPVEPDAPKVDQNLVGRAGVTVAFYSLHYFGAAAYVIPAALFWLSYMFFAANAHKLHWKKWVALVACLLTAASICSMLETQVVEPPSGEMGQIYSGGLGGIIGHFVFEDYLSLSLGQFGSSLLIGGFLIGALITLLHDNLGQIDRLREAVRKAAEARAAKKAAQQAEREAARAAGGGIAVEQKKGAPAPGEATPAAEEPEAAATAKVKPPTPPPGVKLKRPSITPPDKKTVKAPVVKPPEPGPMVEAGPDGDSKPPVPAEEPAATEEGVDAPGPAKAIQPPAKSGKPSLKFEGAPAGSSPKSNLKIIAGAQTVKASSTALPQRKGNYTFPKLELLAEPGADDGASAEEHQATAELLVSILAEFGVKVTMGEVHVGPVITRYDVHPAPGVRVEKIVNLDKNIALGLKALSVRILAPVPGKGCVGIEVPNKKALPVSIRDILESENWVTSKSEIPIALGKEVSGQPLIADLTKMPHLLIAGSTGAGKTVCINAIITSLVYKLSPDDVRFVMVDPKIVEMQVYNDLPHMLVPVVTDPKKVPAALKYLINEMERRYKIFAKLGVRNIAGFNAKRLENARESAVAREHAKELDADLSPEERAAVSSIEVARDEEIVVPDKLPYIVCIVDELADLMMVAPADIETCIARLAQLARAAGIHLILATQRPSVNVITGVIKANLPSRIAFKVASKVDSRTILDAMGADHLIGKGDMLFLPPGSADLVRSQGAFVSDEECNGIVDFLKINGEPQFDEAFQASVELGEGEDGADGEGGGEDLGDELIPDAIEVLRATKRASTSMLQRRLRIGYNRAARIMEILEENDIVGPENGAQPREILKDLDSLNF